MRKLSNATKNRMISVAESSLNDICDIHIPTITGVSLGKNIIDWEIESNVACGFNPSNSMTTIRGEVVTFDCDSLLRISKEVALDTTHEITCRGQRYKVKGLSDGRTVNIVLINRTDENEQPR